MKRVGCPIRGGENEQDAAESRPDGRYVESVDGLTWNFEVKGGKSFIGCAKLSTLSDGRPALAAGSDGTVVIPSSLGGHPVKGIGSRAFEWCGKNITSIIIPDSVTCIKEGAFRDCSGLKSFHVGERNVAYASVDGLLLTKDGKILVEGVNGDIVVPSSVKVIGAHAFSGRRLTSLTIPNGVTSIGCSAFYECSLTSLTIPHGVTKIEDWTFRRCRSLAKISIPSSVTSIGDAAFYKCSSLESVTIPSSVTRIGNEAFWGCGLKSINIPEGVTSIGESAFYSNHGPIASLTIPSSVTSIGAGAFSFLKSLESVTIRSEKLQFHGNPFNGCNRLEKWILPHGNAPFILRGGFLLTKDGKTLVAGPSAKGDVMIPSGVTNIGDGAFDYCMGLMSVTIPNSVTRIGAQAFSRCAGLKALRIPDGVTSIGNHAFSDCHALMGVIIPQGVTSIAEGAFWLCNSLKFVIIPNTVTNIGDDAFWNCSSLRSAMIPDSVKSIGAKAFWACSKLTSVKIPKSITSIGDEAFGACDNLGSDTKELLKARWPNCM